MEAKQKFHEILESYGGETANRSVEQLLEDPQLAPMKHFTDFVAKNWRDCFIPTLMNLGCKFVGGNPCGTEEFAVSFSLMNLSFRIWDDVIDGTASRTLRSTFVGKFGSNNALIYGGTVSAKAFTILSKASAEKVRKEAINELIWNYWAMMAKAETKDLAARANTYNASQKLSKIKEEAINVRTALKIGAVLGNGGSNEIEALESYGNNLAVMLELLKDLKVSLNLTLELEEKLTNGQLSLLLLMAKEESKEVQAKIELLEKNGKITPNNIRELMRVVLDSTSWANFTGYFMDANIKCRDALMGRDGTAAKALIAIANNQYNIFREIAERKK